MKYIKSINEYRKDNVTEILDYILVCFADILDDDNFNDDNSNSGYIITPDKKFRIGIEIVKVNSELLEELELDIDVAIKRFKDQYNYIDVEVQSHKDMWNFIELSIYIDFDFKDFSLKEIEHRYDG